MGMRNKLGRWAAAGTLASVAIAGVYLNRSLITPAQAAEAPAAAREDVARVFAPRLGELTLNSRQNQPFDAEIELTVAADYELADLEVGLADNKDFVRYGLDRPAHLSDFKFEVTRNRVGHPVIKVTSSSPVLAKFVTLLLEAVSGDDRKLREYTVLLDP